MGGFTLVGTTVTDDLHRAILILQAGNADIDNHDVLSSELIADNRFEEQHISERGARNETRRALQIAVPRTPPRSTVCRRSGCLLQSLPCRLVPENDGVAAIDEHALFEVIKDSARQNPLFDATALSHKILGRVIVADVLDIL